jgi:hypothetical protein
MDEGLKFWRRMLATPDGSADETGEKRTDMRGRKTRFKNQLIQNGYEASKAEEISVRCANKASRKQQ